MKVLIADDDSITRKTLEASLSKWGYDVESVENGEQAFEALNKDKHPGVAIIDWMMPGLSGLELCKKIKKTNSDNPPHLIMLTSKDLQEDIIEGLSSGADAYIKKPFFDDELHARIKAAERIVGLQESLKNKINELQESLDHVKQLQGVIPVCMHCHKIRNDEESWDEMEKYIMEHSDATFSHGVCPVCIEEHYPSHKDAILKGDKNYENTDE